MDDSEIPTPVDPKLVDHATDESAVPSVADAIERAFRATYRPYPDWIAEARAAIAAARPILTGPLRDENTRLRTENEQLRRLAAEVSHLRWLTDEHGPVQHALGKIEAMTARLQGVTDTARLLDFAEVEQVYRIAGDAIAVLRETPAPTTTGEG